MEKCGNQKSGKMFTASSCVSSDRILYTPSLFARMNLLHLQETGSLRALSAHTSTRDSLHSFLCFVVLSGSGSLTYQEKVYPLHTGDVVFIDCRKGYSHHTAEPELWSLQWCHFLGPNLPGIYAKYCERGGEPVFHPLAVKPYLQLMSRLYSLAGSDDYIRDMRLNEILSMLLTNVMSESWHQGKRFSETKRMEIQHIKTYLDEHYGEKISLDAVANRFFIDKHYLSRLFKERYDVSLITYLQQVRITHAKRLLRFTDKSIEEIGLNCGIGELSYFSRVFKKLEGITPSEFRRLW